jgi:hypothetical protein
LSKHFEPLGSYHHFKPKGLLMNVRKTLSSWISITFLLITATAYSEPPNYPHALGYVVAQIRYVKWMGELCAERFPEMKAKNTASYLNWKEKNRTFIDEMEGQLALANDRLRKFSPDGADLDSFINAQRQSLKQENEARGEKTYRWMCQLYPERVASNTNDLESALAESVAIVRRGPNDR